MIAQVAAAVQATHDGGGSLPIWVVAAVVGALVTALGTMWALLRAQYEKRVGALEVELVAARKACTDATERIISLVSENGSLRAQAAALEARLREHDEEE